MADSLGIQTDLSARTALVTGGGRGIGLAIAKALAESGARVAVNDLDVARAEVGAREAGHGAIAVAADVSDSYEVTAMFEEVRGRLGPVDILVNNAGVCYRGLIEDISEERWDRVLAVNLKGVFICCKAAVPEMKARKWGRIVNVASISGKIGGLMVGHHYSASKGGVLAFTKGLARELAPYNVTVNAVCPAMTDTEIAQQFSEEEVERYLKTVPLGRLATPGDVAQAALYLVSDAASYLTGEVLDVNGGLLMD